MPPPPPGHDAHPPFPFVVGEARSGTTLLRVMLDAHPRLAVPPESYFVTGLYRFRSRYERREGTFDFPRFASELSRLRKYRDWDLPPETLRAAFAEPRRATFSDAIRLLYRTYAECKGKERYADKTPGYVARMRLITELFPEARFVHIVRDVRSVALSLKDIADDWGVTSVPQGAARWRHRVGRGHREGLQLGPERYLEIRYEDLVDATEPTLRRVFDFIDLEWDPAVLEYERGAMDRIPEGSRAIHSNVARKPTATRDWREQMKPHEVAAVELVAGDLMQELGYERATSAEDASPQARRAAEEAVRWWDDYLRKKKRRGRLRRLLPQVRPGVSHRVE